MKPLKIIEEDIKKMLLVIEAFSKENTQGYELLQEWKNKYLEEQQEG